MICETELCPKGVPCFNIADFDSNDTFPDNAIAMVTADVHNPDEEITFANDSKGNLYHCRYRNFNGWHNLCL